MSKWIALAAGGCVVAWTLGALSLGCAPSTNETAAGSGSGGPTTGASACAACVADSDCNAGESCAQFGSDIFCAPTCPTGNECAADRACTAETSAAGEQVSVCIPKDASCGGGTEPAGVGGTNTCASTSAADAGSSSDPNRCGAFVGPAETAACKSCTTTSSKCQANGCYGGWWCDSTDDTCHATPTGCATPTASSSGGSAGSTVNCDYDGGSAPVTGTAGSNGGSASRLFFAIVGDTRPAVPDDTRAYPTDKITKIYADIAALSPQPLFVVSTGDYMFANPGNGQAAPQLNLYQGARKQFTGPLYPAMGNHECTGATNGNCAASVTENMSAFMASMLTPIGQNKPYYAIKFSATDNSWTAKFVFIAANAWDATQSTWLDATLAEPTTYTFVIRHEPAAANTAPGVTPSEAIMRKYPYTLAIVGHTHTYAHSSSTSKQITIGNGGAPLTGGVNYGFGLVSQRADGTFQIDVIDYLSGNYDPSFRFAIHGDGSPAPL